MQIACVTLVLHLEMEMYAQLSSAFSHGSLHIKDKLDKLNFRT